ncbi:uncharacterized protein EV422DRAFT_581472 [Fimicolochytrium jonesii]|uniref:uncharacterized protein n=1 Tax=Fimicolochytrium jonesii TaxID=1396493 RepID=UPI0022FF30BB|nr:uncharacterized protein EV422DRAFT_581472 [Fimicolochytrium jonesii]KAI8816414.1 hypothetical protein EV422DRAFT_581472 [Fimicolochytrium jonesii]
MSSLYHLFGNVDEKTGRLQEDADLPEELRETLEDSGDYLSALLGGDFGLGGDSDGQDGARAGGEIVQPNLDAEDFSGIGNEDLAEDDVLKDIPLPQPAIQMPSQLPPTLMTPKSISSEPHLNGVNGHMDHAAERQPHADEIYDEARLARLFPGYDASFMHFSTMFTASMARKPKPVKKMGRMKQSVRNVPYFVARDDRELFDQQLPSQLPRAEGRVREVALESLEPASPDSAKEEPEPWLEDLHPALYPVLLETWEDRILWEDDESDHVSSERGPQKSIVDRFALRNYDLEEMNWEDDVHWDSPDDTAASPLEPNPSETPHTPAVAQKQTTSRWRDNRSDASNAWKLKRFNISHDRYYENETAVGADRVRQTYGPATLQHALPAIKLHPQWYKYNLSKKELRSFHRPGLRFTQGNTIRFTRVRLKKKKSKGKDTSDMMRNPSDITLKDATGYALLEYSEEYPPILMNPGMATLIYNYYRKSSAKDTTLPQMEMGTPFLLEEVDASPFLGFGDVEPGETLQAITNNMFRAPIFEHRASDTDFLVIKQTFHGETKYFLREIPNLFTVGQTYPLQEVPRPQSRKITQTIKGRLQAVTFRNMHKDPFKRLKYDSIVKLFPHFTETQLKQRLKEFAQFAKKGENTGWWKLKQGVRLPNEEEIRRLVTPEMICLQESMQTGQQRLTDIGYSDIAAMDDENDEDEATGDIEVQLAPWTTTKNFVSASQNKSMIKLYGPGDPSGRGEAFSFIRASMKEPFLRFGESAEDRAERESLKPKGSHRFSFAEQQQVYREEIKRIWAAQLASLRATDPPVDEGEETQFDIEALSSRQQQMEMAEEDERRRQYSGGYSDQRLTDPGAAGQTRPPATASEGNHLDSDSDIFSDDDNHRAPSTTRDREQDDATSIAESGTSYGQQGRSKRLTIRRIYRNPTTGEEEEKSEVITDMKIINAYLRQRAIIESQEAAEKQRGEDNPETERRRKRKNVQDHVMQMKEGKRRRAYREAHEEEPAHEPLVLRIRNPSLANAQAGHLWPPDHSDTNPTHRKRGSVHYAHPSVVEDYLLPHHPKSYGGRRRANSEVELSSTLERIITDLVANPDAYEFCRPVSAVHVPDYYVIVRKPKTLEQIRDDVKNYLYKTPSEFMRDLHLVANNCRLYNGAHHPLTLIADSLVARANTLLLNAPGSGWTGVMDPQDEEDSRAALPPGVSGRGAGAGVDGGAVKMEEGVVKREEEGGEGGV